MRQWEFNFCFTCALKKGRPFKLFYTVHCVILVWKAPSNPNFHQKPPQIQIFTKSPLKSYCILPYFLVNTFNKELNEYLIYSKQFYLQNNQLAPFTRIMNISSAGLSLVCFGWRGQRPPPIIWGPPPYGGGDRRD